MLSHNSKYELKRLVRNKWIQVLSALLLIIFCFAIYNGNQKVEKLNNDITAAIDEQNETDTEMLKLLDSIEQGMDVSASRWTIPSNPMAVGNYHPRVVAKTPGPLAFIATGQADVFTHYVKPTVSGDDFALNFTEMTSPIQLLFGSFDIAFVIVFLLPLIIIAFSYNVLSAERENGTLRLLASQPIGVQTWLIQKLGLRFLWLVLITIISLTLLMFIFGYNPLDNLQTYLGLMGITAFYMLFWFSLAFVINIFGGHSSKNALALLSLWIVLVLLVPSVLNQISSTIYPMPSRSLMINDMRSLKADVTKKQDEILDNYLRDHPEYAINDTSQTRNFYHRFMASQQLLKEQIAPEVKKFEEQLKNQQNWLDNFKWISPAVIVQESLNKMAGSSASDYENYRMQVISFSEEWRNHFIPLLYNNKTFTSQDYENLPSFEYQISSGINLRAIPILFVLSIVIVGFGFMTSSGLVKSKLIIQT